MVIGSVRAPGKESHEAIGGYLRDRFAGAKFPVAAGFPAGHLQRTRALPLGSVAVLDLDGRRELFFRGPAVS
jgi:muramoyltetrapeptide carboxypeptidase LdcA involved in peptidoglycan recycling